MHGGLPVDILSAPELAVVAQLRPGGASAADYGPLTACPTFACYDLEARPPLASLAHGHAAPAVAATLRSAEDAPLQCTLLVLAPRHPRRLVSALRALQSLQEAQCACATHVARVEHCW